MSLLRKLNQIMEIRNHQLMEVHVKLCGIFGLAIVFLWGTMNLASAQVRIVDISEFDQVNIRKPQAIQLQLEKMQQSNDFERLMNFKEGSRFRRIGRPVGRLKVKVQDDRQRVGVLLCTASIISATHILTNFHCIPGLPGTTVIEAKLEMDYLDELDTTRVREFKVAAEPDESSAILDYAIVKVYGNPAASYGTIPISLQLLAQKDAIFIIHHPEGAPKILSRKDCYITKTKGAELTHSCDTLGGSSGSPVFSDETFQMIGLHFAGNEQGNVGKSIVRIQEQSPILKELMAAASPVTPSPSPAPPVQEPAPSQTQETPQRDKVDEQLKDAADFWSIFGEK